MPITHRVDPKQRILFVTRTGSIDTHDEQEAFAQRSADPLIVPGIAVLVDCRGVEPVDSTATVRYLADRVTALASRLGCGPVAIVVGSDAEYGMARMYQALTDLAHANTRVFRDHEEALAWLRRGGDPAAF